MIEFSLGADTGPWSSRPVPVSAPAACRALLAVRGGSAPALAVVAEADDGAEAAGIAGCALSRPADLGDVPATSVVTEEGSAGSENSSRCTVVLGWPTIPMVRASSASPAGRSSAATEGRLSPSTCGNGACFAPPGRSQPGRPSSDRPAAADLPGLAVEAPTGEPVASEAPAPIATPASVPSAATARVASTGLPASADSVASERVAAAGVLDGAATDGAVVEAAEPEVGTGRMRVRRIQGGSASRSRWCRGTGPGTALGAGTGWAGLRREPAGGLPGERRPWSSRWRPSRWPWDR